MQEVTLRDYISIVFRQKKVVVTTFFAVVVTVGIGLLFMTPVYEASVKMVISAQKEVAAPYYRELSVLRDLGPSLTESEIIKSNPVMELSVRALGLHQRPLDYEKKFCSFLKSAWIDLYLKLLDRKLRRLTPQQREGRLFWIAVRGLKESVEVEPVTGTNMLTILARDFDPLGAAVIANTVSRAYIIFDLEQQLAELQTKYGDKHSSVIQLKETIEAMAKKLSGGPLPDIEAIGPATVKVIEQASIPSEPADLPPFLIILLAAFVGLVLGLILAFLFEYLDQTFKTPQDIERVLQLPCLGFIPRKAEAASYQNVADQIYFEMKDKKLRSLILTSAVPGEGVTKAAVNAAALISGQQRRKILLIDANLRKPSVHEALQLPLGPGLTEVLEEKVSFEKAARQVGSSMSVLTAGHGNLNPSTLLESHRMADFLKNAAERFDFVFIDAPNIRESRDVLGFYSCVDAAVLIVAAGKTRKQVVRSLLGPFLQKKVHILGAVLNNRTFSIPKKIYEMV